MKKFLVLLISVLIFSLSLSVNFAFAEKPEIDINKLFLRAEFSTNYTYSVKERKDNISLAVKSINNTVIKPNGEFSFNATVGERTTARGYKSAKVIVNGEFTEGIGGGVCQVSTTIYNAVILAGLKITEYHPHSLTVSYVSPSLDAMVNFGHADLRFINTTSSAVIIKATANGNDIRIKIYGEKMQEKFSLKSEITEYIPPPQELVIIDSLGEYKDLKAGESKILVKGKSGCKSKAYLIKSINGKTAKEVIRVDNYLPVQGKRVVRE